MNLYEILGVKPNATIAEIKNAYRKKAVENHPDKKGGSPEKMAAINHAKDILTDPIKKERYDKTGNDGREPSFEQRFRQTLDDLLLQIIKEQSNNPEKIDVIGLIKSSIQDGMVDYKKKKSVMVSQIQKMVVIKKRTKTKSKDKTIQFILDARIKQWNHTITNMSLEIKYCEDCLEFLKQYTYDFEPEPVRMPGMITINMM